MLSVVIPFYNEETVAEGVLTEILAIMRPLGQSFEVIAVDDCSTDGTPAVLARIRAAHGEVRVLRAKARGGQSAALSAGFKAARGAIVVTLDGDGQNDPSAIPALLAALEGADLTAGVRARRKDTGWKRLSSRIANAYRRRALDDPFRDVGCGLKAFRREVLESIPYFKNMHRYFPLLAQWQGFKVVEVEVRHRPRAGGASKYGTWDRLTAGLADLRGVKWLKKRLIRYPVEELKS
jgi:dolichol-phosphate mannosyltransferase